MESYGCVDSRGAGHLGRVPLLARVDSWKSRRVGGGVGVTCAVNLCAPLRIAGDLVRPTTSQVDQNTRESEASVCGTCPFASDGPIARKGAHKIRKGAMSHFERSVTHDVYGRYATSP